MRRERLTSSLPRKPARQAARAGGRHAVCSFQLRAAVPARAGGPERPRRVGSEPSHREAAMPQDNRPIISTLNGLIETCKDAQNGFQTAADAVHNPDLKNLFRSY